MTFSMEKQTGIFDENGDEVYVGEVVTVTFPEHDESFSGPVSFDIDKVNFIIQDPTKGETTVDPTIPSKHIEKIK